MSTPNLYTESEQHLATLQLEYPEIFQCSLDGAEQLDVQWGRRPFPERIALMPVATHQEWSYIYRTLGLCALAGNSAPSVILGLNEPTGADRRQTDRTRDEIKRAQRNFPDLDMAVIELGDIPPDTFTIGLVRKMLWSTVPLVYTDRLSRKKGTTVNPHMYNMDADTLKITGEYFDRTNHRFRSQAPDPLQRNHPVTTRGRHGLYPGLPNLNRLITLYDGIRFWSYENFFEATVSLGLRAYVLSGGFDPTKHEGETLSILDHLGQHRHPVKHPIPVTSARRLAHRFLEGRIEIWDGSFAQTETLRTAGDPSMDIDDESANELAVGLLSNMDDYYALLIKSTMRHRGTKEARRLVRYGQRLIAACGFPDDGTSTQLQEYFDSEVTRMKKLPHR